MAPSYPGTSSQLSVVRLPRVWQLITNESWPTRVIPFIRRGQWLKAKLHRQQLEELAQEQELSLSPELLDEILLPIDARLLRIFQALHGK